MTAKPLTASVIDKYQDGEGKEQSYWTDVGRAFPHKDGKGYNVVIRPGLSINGTLVLREPSEREKSEAPPAPAPQTDDGYNF